MKAASRREQYASPVTNFYGIPNMKAVFNLSNLLTRFPNLVLDKLRPARCTALSAKLAGVGSSPVTLTAWRKIDSDSPRWYDPLPYSYYRLPRLKVTSVVIEPHRNNPFSEYFLPQQTHGAERVVITAAMSKRTF
jgi:hypothetical protein